MHIRIYIYILIVSARACTNRRAHPRACASVAIVVVVIVIVAIALAVVRGGPRATRTARRKRTSRSEACLATTSEVAVRLERSAPETRPERT